MQEKNIESWHILFPDDDLGAFLKKINLLKEVVTNLYGK